ncbi:MAG: hypothetical protein GF411_08700 [Candidatus Lokiarchaeota archaeon]|nr:hypothetical protein [Candidatus Lokiarchaeota archaeon]
MFGYFHEKFPELFSENLISFCCGEGWKGIIEDVFEKIKDRGAKVIQVKEKFGVLRIYLGHHHLFRIEIYEGGDWMCGLKDGSIVGKECPDSEPMITFVDNSIPAADGQVLFYVPNTDIFLNEKLEEIEPKDRDFIKGRLASLTGLVDVDPIEEEKIDDIISRAEEESSKVCEICGTRDDVTNETPAGSWIKTLCGNCRRNRFNQ